LVGKCYAQDPKELMGKCYARDLRNLIGKCYAWDPKYKSRKSMTVFFERVEDI